MGKEYCITLTDLLQRSIEKKASDLHLSSGLPPRLRIHGELMPQTDLPALPSDSIKNLLYSIMSKTQQQTLEEKLEFDFAVSVPNVASFRVNVFHQCHGLAAVFRIIPTIIPSMEELNLPQVIQNLLQLPHGLILVTGPTGSGKSTTLASMLDHINTEQACHIITIEDPIEFTHTSRKSLINQRQVHRDTHEFAAALRAALREDPDVILIGEMRDLETIRLALTAAETGHLVMATLHTSSAPRSVNRIIDVFPASEKNMIRNMLSESLQAVICQTLIPRLSGGRIAALEIMLGSPAIRNLIREDKIAQMHNTIQTSADVGMCTLAQYLQSLVHQQMICPAVASDFTDNKAYSTRPVGGLGLV